MEPRFDIFRRKLGGTLAFVGSTQSLELAQELVKTTEAQDAAEQFVIYNVFAHEVIMAGEQSGMRRLPVPRENVP
jgi:hypothetical protein